MNEIRQDFGPEEVKQKVKDERKTKTFSIIASIIIALTLWIYVIGEVNPTTTTTIENVPVRLLNVDSLTNRELAIVGNGQYFVNVVVEGKRAEIGKIESSEVEATADLIGFGLGDNYVRVNVTAPAGVTISEVKASRILVTIDHLVAINKPVEVAFAGEMGPDTEEGAVEVKPAEVEVSGAESEVGQVEKIQVVVEASAFSAEGATVQAEALPMNGAGMVVESVRLSSSIVDVSAKLYKTKEVPVNIITTGDVKEGYGAVITGLERVKIKGSKEALKEIDSVNTQPVDLSGITVSGDVTLKLNLPKGVQLAKGTGQLVASVKVAPFIKKEFNYPADQISLKGVPEGKRVSLQTGAITITAKGTEDVLRTLIVGDFTLSVDVSGLKDGTHQVGVNAASAAKLQEIIINPEKISITIETEAEKEKVPE